MLDGVFEVLVRKLCNIRIQEFISSTKQQLAVKKGLASTVDVNLQTTLLARFSQETVQHKNTRIYFIHKATTCSEERTGIYR